MRYKYNLLDISKNISLEEYIANSELVQAAIVEATHRYYNDMCFKGGKFEASEENARVSNILSNLWCLIPDWRIRLSKAIKRYVIPIAPNSEVKGLLVSDKPKKIYVSELKINVHEVTDYTNT